MKLLKLMPVLLALSWLYGCATKATSVDGGSQSDRVQTEGMALEDPNVNPLDDVSSFDATTDTIIDNGAETKVIVADGGGYQSYEFAQLNNSDELDNPAGPLANRTIYFDYDSAVVKERDQAVLESHATYLNDNPNVIVRLIGHTDERGSREYNLALGERRALAIRQVLMLQGVSVDQLQVISMGEERPKAEGAYESAWQQNRRVELLYLGQ